MTSKDPVIRELEAARIKLIIEWPIFGAIILQLELKEVDWCGTAATDGRYFYYNREFIKRLNKSQLLFLTAHEILHCFPAGTIVAGEFKPIEEFNIGDHVIGKDSNNSTVVMPMAQHYDGELIILKGRGLLPVKVTSEHPIMVCRSHWKGVVYENGKRGNIREWSEINEVLAKDVQLGDWVYIPRIKGNIVNYIMNFEYMNEWAIPENIKQGIFLDQEIAENTDLLTRLGKYT